MTCRVCGRPIHDPLSVSRGRGPVCYERDRIQLRLDFELFEEEEDENKNRANEISLVGLSDTEKYRARNVGMALVEHRYERRRLVHMADHILPPRLTFWQRLVRWLGL